MHNKDILVEVISTHMATVGSGDNESYADLYNSLTNLYNQYEEEFLIKLIEKIK